MKFPLIISREEFAAIKPRKHLGQRIDLSKDQQEMLEVIDVLDQRSEWSADVAITNRYLLLLVMTASLPKIWEILQGILKGLFGT